MRGLNITLWVLQWILGMSLVAAGLLLVHPWAASVVCVVGGLGVLLPSVTRVVPRVTVVTAIWVAAVTIFGVVLKLLRGETAGVAVNVVLAVMAIAIAFGRSRVAPITGQLPDPPRLTAPLPTATPPPGMKIVQLPTGTYVTRAVFAIRGGAFNDLRHFAATAVLIQHPKGDVLIDAGFGANADIHIASLPSFRRSPHDLGETVSDQLDAAGYDRTRLLGVLLTHSHWDHVSGLDSLDVAIWTTAQELDYADRAKDDTVFKLVSAGREIREYTFDGPAYLGFPASHDFYGDGSVVIVPAPGHTTGSVVIFVTVPSGQRYAFIGDLTWQLDGVTRRLERPLMLRMLADSDARQIRTDLARVIALSDRMQIVPAHDTRAYGGIPLLLLHEEAPEGEVSGRASRRSRA
jgi:N-acyl homoserine lactone hydrolase